MTEDTYIAINRQSWNERTELHLKSDFYDMEAFLEGKSSLKPVELAMLGDVSGKRILHLQCHFGQDTISLARAGAVVTGVDFSDKAIDRARLLADEVGAEATFICCDVYDLPEHLSGQFDIVFTSYGVIGWLPDLNRWAEIISSFLKPEGRLVFVEFHPVVWMFDDHFEYVRYNYFKAEAIMETENGSYADRSAPVGLSSVTWNHSISEVVNSLLGNGLELCSLNEFDYSPYNCFDKTIEVEPGKFRIAHLSNFIPMVYSVMAVKKQTDG